MGRFTGVRHEAWNLARTTSPAVPVAPLALTAPFFAPRLAACKEAIVYVVTRTPPPLLKTPWSPSARPFFFSPAWSVSTCTPGAHSAKILSHTETTLAGATMRTRASGFLSKTAQSG